MPLTHQQFLTLIGAPDILTIVLRGQQAVEGVLDAAISEALPEPHALEIEKLSFALKADLALALGVIRADSRGAFLALSRLRNRFAHSLTAEFEQREAADLENALSNWQRQLVGHEPFPLADPRNLLRRVIAVLFAECSGAQHRLQDAKLAQEVLTEMVEETLSDSPPADNNTFLTGVEQEMRDRIETKRRRVG